MSQEQLDGMRQGQQEFYDQASNMVGIGRGGAARGPVMAASRRPLANPPPRLSKAEVIPGETDFGAIYDVHVNPGSGRLRSLLDESKGSLRVLPGSRGDAAISNADRATHADMQMALMDSDHPMLGQLDPSGAENLGWLLRGSKGTPVPGTARVGDWNVRVEVPAANGQSHEIVDPAQWPIGLRRSMGFSQ